MSIVEAAPPSADEAVPSRLPSLFSAYQAVFRNWRVLAPVMFGQATLLLVVLVAGWLVSGGSMTVNGRPVVAQPLLAMLIIMTSAATLHIGAGAALSALRGQTVRRTTLVWHSGAVSASLLIMYAALIILLETGLVTASGAGPWKLPVIFAASLVVLVATHLTCWVALVKVDEGIRGPAAVRRALALARAAESDVWVRAVVGSALPPGVLLLAYLLGELFTGQAVVPQQWLAVLLALLASLITLALVALAVLLAGAAIAFGYQRAVLQAATQGGERADLPVDVAQRPGRGRLRFAVGAVLLLAAGAAVVVNPRGAREINLVRLPEPVLAIGLPDGQPPVLVTRGSVLDCRNDACTEYEEHRLTPKAAAPVSVVDAVVAGDGSVFLLLHDRGAQQLRLSRCNRSGDCQDGAMVTDLSELMMDSMDPATGVTGAIGLSPGRRNADGPIGVVTVFGAATDYRISVLSCADIGCDGSVRHDFGGIGKFDGPDRHAFSVLVDAQGLPTVGYRTRNHDVFIGSCDSSACSAPQLTQLHSGAPGGQAGDSRLALALLGDDPIVYDQLPAPAGGPGQGAPRGRLMRCVDARCAGSTPHPDGGTWIGPALAVTDRTAHTAGISDGRLVVRSCVAEICEQTRLIELDSASDARLAVAPDGRRAISYRTGDGKEWLVSYA